MFYSATLHSEPVKKLVQNITKYPTWVDLKGESMIPEVLFLFSHIIYLFLHFNKIKKTIS